MSNDSVYAELKSEIESPEDAALLEEKENVDRHYHILKKEYEDTLSKRLYPIGPYDTFRDAPQQQDANYFKSQNKRYEDLAKETKAYFDCENLYIGHVNTDGADYYITDHRLLPTKVIKDDTYYARIVNFNSEDWKHIVEEWLYPESHEKVIFSRNITMQNKEVTEIYIRRDTRNDILKDIQDVYLRKVLERNKNQDEIVSILQTIQMKQNEIRSMDANQSFIVQGCAGSGKTMILLHRLKYLLYNKYLERGNYIVLVPSSDFIDFISNISNQFGIHKQSILSYYNFYKYYATGSLPQSDNSEIDESTLSSEYLNRIYSSQFITDCYNDVINYYISNAQSLIKKCKDEMDNIIDREVELLTKQEDKENKNLYKSIRNLTSAYSKRLTHSKISSMNDVELLLSELHNIANNSNDSDEILKINEIISNIIAQRQSYYELEKSLDDKLESIEDDVYQKYFGDTIILLEQAINGLSLKRFIEVEKLPIIYNILNDITSRGKNVLSKYATILRRQRKRTTEEKNTLIQKHIAFAQNTEQQTKEFMIYVFELAVRDRIKVEFKAKLNKQYKHYWYLKAYFKYITYGSTMPEQKYVFIDEAQDLSESEIKLIRNINASENYAPVMNLFGDIKQAISDHSIKSWDCIGISNIYHLDENFRNTNQIIDYCEEQLGISMTRVGVNMDKVRKYRDFGEMLDDINNIPQLYKSVFIVRDGHRKDSLTQIFNSPSKKYAAIQGCPIFTVKECKGLEFKTVFVFDDDMTINEKYVAYTRALIQLNIIKKFPLIYNTPKRQ